MRKRNKSYIDCEEKNKTVFIQRWHSVQLLFVTLWTAACQASLSFTNSRSWFKLMSIQSVMPSNHLVLCCPLLLLPSIFPSIGDFPMSKCFLSGDQSIGVSASASVLPMNIQGWFPFGLTGLITLLSKGLGIIQFETLTWVSAHPTLWCSSHIRMRLLEKPQLWLDGPLSAKWCVWFSMCCLGFSQLFFQGASVF